MQAIRKTLLKIPFFNAFLGLDKHEFIHQGDRFVRFYKPGEKIEFLGNEYIPGAHFRSRLNGFEDIKTYQYSSTNPQSYIPGQSDMSTADLNMWLQTKLSLLFDKDDLSKITLIVLIVTCVLALAAAALAYQGMQLGQANQDMLLNLTRR